ncbi:MAG: hypothetical protein EOP04_00060 [Proteobacteria bacterium]|nr:MAG: hypothetical protein EOP04_00060 [Pseudomonadota bacterium]
MKSKASNKSARDHRKFTAEFKAEDVRLSHVPSQPIAQVTKDLGLADGVLRAWTKQADADNRSGKSNILTTVEKEELSALRREVKQLRMET